MTDQAQQVRHVEARTVTTPGVVTAAAVGMFAGAALSLVGLVGSVLSLAHVARHLGLDAAGMPGLVVGPVISIVAIGLWTWLALACLAGRPWVRSVATGLFAGNVALFVSSTAWTVATTSLTLPVLLATNPLGLALLALGLAVVVLLWLPATSAYVRARSPR